MKNTTKKKTQPETIKEDLWRSIIKTADRDDSVLNEAVRNVEQTNKKVAIIKQYEVLVKIVNN